MPAQEISFEKGTGPEQLPAGAATETNAQLPTLTASQPDPMEGMAPPEEATPQAAAPADFAPDYQPEDEDAAFITGPTGRPSEAQSAGTAPRRSIPPRVARNLSLLQQAASAPGASAELQALVAYLVRNA